MPVVNVKFARVDVLGKTTAEQTLEGCLGNFYSSKASGKSVSTKEKNLLVLKRRESKEIV